MITLVSLQDRDRWFIHRITIDFFLCRHARGSTDSFLRQFLIIHRARNTPLHQHQPMPAGDS